MGDTAFKGVVVPMITPFDENMHLDEDALKYLTNWLCSQNVDLLLPLGGSGEYNMLSLEEKKKVISIVIEAAQGRVPVIPHTAGLSFDETIELSVYAQSIGADGITMAVPEFVGANEDQIFNFYRSLSCEVETPIMIYDPRGSGPRSVTPRLMARFVNEIDKIKAIKYRNADVERTAWMVEAAGDNVAVLSGIETTFLSDLALGVKGVVGGGANIFPGILSEILHSFQKCNLSDARSRFITVLKMNQVLARVAWPLSGKVALGGIGLPIKPVVRLTIESPPFSLLRSVKEYFRDWSRGKLIQ